jgi:hypothetical protein
MNIKYGKGGKGGSGFNQNAEKAGGTIPGPVRYLVQ